MLKLGRRVQEQVSLERETFVQEYLRRHPEADPGVLVLCHSVQNGTARFWIEPKERRSNVSTTKHTIEELL